MALAYVAVKACLFHYSLEPIPAACMMLLSAMFSLLHIVAARRAVAWARQRMAMGLIGWGISDSFHWEAASDGNGYDILQWQLPAYEECNGAGPGGCGGGWVWGDVQLMITCFIHDAVGWGLQHHILLTFFVGSSTQ